jgi:hypothetical protein
MYKEYANEFYDQILTPMINEICGWLDAGFKEEKEAFDNAVEDGFDEEFEDEEGFEAKKEELLDHLHHIDRDSVTFNLKLTDDDYDCTLRKVFEANGLQLEFWVSDYESFPQELLGRYRRLRARYNREAAQLIVSDFSNQYDKLMEEAGAGWTVEIIRDKNVAIGKLRQFLKQDKSVVDAMVILLDYIVNGCGLKPEWDFKLLVHTLSDYYAWAFLNRDYRSKGLFELVRNKIMADYLNK